MTVKKGQLSGITKYASLGEALKDVVKQMDRQHAGVVNRMKNARPTKGSMGGRRW